MMLNQRKRVIYLSKMEINTNKMRDDFICCVCGGREASGITLHQYTKGKLVKDDEYGNEVLLYPRISFTRLAIRDNEQFFDAAFQLYQKGSISIDLILDILNIDPDSTKDKIERDLFTVNDALFNEVMRNLYTNVAAPLVDNTDAAEKIAEQGVGCVEGKLFHRKDVGTPKLLQKRIDHMNSILNK